MLVQGVSRVWKPKIHLRQTLLANLGNVMLTFQVYLLVGAQAQVRRLRLRREAGLEVRGLVRGDDGPRRREPAGRGRAHRRLPHHLLLRREAGQETQIFNTTSM